MPLVSFFCLIFNLYALCFMLACNLQDWNLIWNILMALRPNLLLTVYRNTLYLSSQILHFFLPWGNAPFSIATGCLYKLSRINLVWGPLKCIKSNFNPVHVFLHFKSFCLVVLQLILASKLSEWEQFENFAANYQCRKQ